MAELPRSHVLIPLYIFPDPGAWEPLFTAVSKYPNLKFTVIVNPHNGPGSRPWWPNADYVREIPRLNAYPNVRTVGYIHTTYCKRPNSEICNDIDVYGEWSKDTRFRGLSVQGIFFDETPNRCSEEVKSYLNEVTRKVKETKGILGDRIVIHNPGTAVDAGLANPGPDVTTVVETSYEAFETKEYQEWLATSPCNREGSCYMIHSAGEVDMHGFVRGLRRRAEYIFVTSAKENYYQSFGKSWEQFLEAMAES